MLNRSTVCLCASRDLIPRVTYRYLHRDYSPGNNKGASCRSPAKTRVRRGFASGDPHTKAYSDDRDCATTDLHKHETYLRLSEERT